MPEQGLMKPILVNGPTARKLIGCARTKYHALVKAGRIETVVISGRRMVVYSSLERLAQPAPQAGQEAA